MHSKQICAREQLQLLAFTGSVFSNGRCGSSLANMYTSDPSCALGDEVVSFLLTVSFGQTCKPSRGPDVRSSWDLVWRDGASKDVPCFRPSFSPLNFNKFSGVLLLNLAARLGLGALVARLLLLPPRGVHTQVISGLKVGFILGREYIRRGVVAPGPLDSGLSRPGGCLQGTLALMLPIRPWPLRQRQAHLFQALEEAGCRGWIRHGLHALLGMSCESAGLAAALGFCDIRSDPPRPLMGLTRKW